MKVVMSHVCPRCRVRREDWQVKGTKAPGTIVTGRRAHPEPIDAATIDALEILLAGSGEMMLDDDCPACGAHMTGWLQVEQKPGAPLRVLGVSER